MTFLTVRDYHQLGAMLGSDAEKIRARLRSRDGLSSWRVHQLRAVIKFFRKKFEDVNHQIPHWLTTNKGKAQCIDIILQCVGALPKNVTAGYAAAGAAGMSAPVVHGYSMQQAAQIVAAQQAYRRSFGSAADFGTAGYPMNHTAAQTAQALYNYRMHSQVKQSPAKPPDVNEVCQSIEFIQLRSPFHTILKRYTACPVLPSRRSKFSFELDPVTVNRLRCKDTIALHFRLFDTVKKCHQEWNKFAGVSVQINNVFKQFQQKPSAISGTKAKGHQIVKALDVSAEASTKMQVILFSQYNLTGIIAVELVRLHTVEEIAELIRRRSKEAERCEVCPASTNLMRCSQCKSAWYCGLLHQQNDWPHHQKICSLQPTKPGLKTLQSIQASAGDDSGDIVCGESRISLRCPLTVCRIKTPVRGVDCLHPQCVDLVAFLGFSNRTSIWQCPVCMKPLKFGDLLVDDKMKDILEKTNEDVDQVRLFPDDTFVPITLEEIREEDRKSQMARASRKRKSPSSSMVPETGVSLDTVSGAPAAVRMDESVIVLD